MTAERFNILKMHILFTKKNYLSLIIGPQFPKYKTDTFLLEKMTIRKELLVVSYLNGYVYKVK